MANKLKIAICGFTGKMGLSIYQLAIKDPDLIVSVIKTRNISAIKNRDISSIETEELSLSKDNSLNYNVTEINSDTVVTDSLLSKLSKDFDLVIDFTLPDGVIKNLEECVKLKKPIVIGATGFNAEQIKLINKAAKEIPVLFSPNMSLGINLLYKLLSLTSKIIGNDWYISIDEIHHKNKKDSPSGTALYLKQVISDSLINPEKIIPINSHRTGEVAGEHRVTFFSDNERLEFSHKAVSRDIFAKGAIQAAKWLKDKPIGLYSMQDVISDHLSVI